MLVVYLFIYKLIIAANPPECHSSMLSSCGLSSNPYHSSLSRHSCQASFTDEGTEAERV